MSLLNNLDIANVPACVPRINRIISPAQEGLLDYTSHCEDDASNLVEALNWVQRVVAGSVAGGATDEAADKLFLIENLTRWLNDVVLEKQGLVEYEGHVIRFEDFPYE